MTKCFGRIIEHPCRINFFRSHTTKCGLQGCDLGCVISRLVVERAGSRNLWPTFFDDPFRSFPFQLRLLEQGLPLRDGGAEGAVRAHQGKQGTLLTRSLQSDPIRSGPASKMRRRAGVGAIQKKKLEGAMYKDKGNALQGHNSTENSLSLKNHLSFACLDIH